MSILKFLGLDENALPDEARDNVLSRIRAGLEQIGPAKARYIASFAHILARVAGADEALSEDEVREIERAVRLEGGLDDSQTAIVLELARNRNLLGDAADFLVTAEFARVSNREQKMQLLNCLFAVAAAEGNISTVEDDLIRQIGGEIHLPDRDFVAVRYRYLKHLQRSAGAAPR